MYAVRGDGPVPSPPRYRGMATLPGLDIYNRLPLLFPVLLENLRGFIPSNGRSYVPGVVVIKAFVVQYNLALGSNPNFPLLGRPSTLHSSRDLITNESDLILFTVFLNI